MWTLEEAQQLVSGIEPVIRELGYHTMLGGGVLHRGSSEKDLDLFFSPLNGYESQAHEVLKTLGGIFGWQGSRALRDGPDYHADANAHWDEMFLFTYDDKRIDVFIQ